MVDILAEEMEGMEDMWDDILENVRACSINTQQDTLFEELSRLVMSARRIMDVDLLWLGKFYVGSPSLEGPMQEVTRSPAELQMTLWGKMMSTMTSLAKGQVRPTAMQ